ncbi:MULTISPECIES: shikimate dehydrogenase [Haloferax]|uniref:Shikimate dehydrogenase (NADP(+)) n=2 Tax=Haloferax TaxID=2251 RepID=A0A6G1YYL1_9EURY|nr:MULTISPECIES: shikimate dehydrogenase [Haloferax]KAB1186525.1 shikimate dehydrogenase [Haloferax sp. CBA1149]MRW79134.1 shikimate dehydrogenase [Haloferax marinisediminis]
MQVYGLVGNPVGHSLSPPMHEAAYEATGVDARYVTFEPELSAIEAAITGADALGIAGLNVTIPFKQDVLELVDPDPLAERIGAVNTIDFGPDGPVGYNTDAAGVTRALERHGVELDGSAAVVVGAGGAGRAAAFALADAGSSVHIANRTPAKAEELASAVPGATGGGLDTLDRIHDADILVNATSVGMEAPDETPVPASYLHADLAVLDAVYTPIETRLLREAADAGAVTVDGAWMLLLQGVEAFEVWTGLDAPVEAMNTALRSHLSDD